MTAQLADWTIYDSITVQIPDTTGFAQELARELRVPLYDSRRWRQNFSPLAENLSGADFSIVNEGDFQIEAIAGEPVTVESIERKRALQERVTVLQQMKQLGISWNRDNQGGISEDTLVAAQSFLALLDLRISLPSLSADGEGGVILSWRESGSLTLVTIDNWRIHVVTAATTPKAEYLDDIPFDGQRIPRQVLDKIEWELKC